MFLYLINYNIAGEENSRLHTLITDTQKKWKDIAKELLKENKVAFSEDISDDALYFTMKDNKMRIYHINEFEYQ